jgi:hypothetical protein
MKIVKNEFGKATLVYNQDEAKPLGGLYLPEVIELVAEKYGFVSKPTLEAAQKETKFHNGQVKISGNRILVNEMTLYNDGISVTSSDTDSAAAVLEDAVVWASSALGLRATESAGFVYLENHVVVDFDHDLGTAFRAFEILKRGFESALHETYDEVVSTYFSAFALGPDPVASSRVSKIPFSIARRVGYPYREHRYYSIAPLRTMVHHQLLSSFEKAIME